MCRELPLFLLISRLCQQLTFLLYLYFQNSFQLDSLDSMKHLETEFFLFSIHRNLALLNRSILQRCIPNSICQFASRNPFPAGWLLEPYTTWFVSSSIVFFDLSSGRPFSSHWSLLRQSLLCSAWIYCYYLLLLLLIIAFLRVRFLPFQNHIFLRSTGRPLVHFLVSNLGARYFFSGSSLQLTESTW